MIRPLYSAITVISFVVGLNVIENVESKGMRQSISDIMGWKDEQAVDLNQNAKIFAHASESAEIPQEFFWYNEVSRESSWHLPWQEHQSPDGDKFYYNTETKTTSWKKEPEHDWQEVISDGKTFYYNPQTQQKQWEKPASLAWVKKSANQFFWYNTKTEESQWDTPAEIPVQSIEHPGRQYYVKNGESTWDAPHSWKDAVDERTGQKFYYNEASHEKTWDAPAEMSWLKVYIDYDK